jgi:hypothetical protein
LARYRTSKSGALEGGLRPAARRVELDYAAAAAVAAKSDEEQRSMFAEEVLHDSRRHTAQLEAEEAAAARQWTLRLIESGCGTSREDLDYSDLDLHRWGGDAEVIDEKARAFNITLLLKSSCRM